jgi:uncharacterized protein YndB with AHSA1/START domain
MITTIITSTVILAAAFAAVVASRPSEFRITRSAVIAADPATVFAQVNDVRRFQDWSPWAKRDPQAKMTFEGPSAGNGAAFSWSGNRGVGHGTMTVTESQPNERVQFRLDFLKPMKATNTAEFTFEPTAEGTRVTWSMYGNSEFMCKAIGMFMNMDKTIGGDFEKGLAELTRIAEAASERQTEGALAAVH